MVKGSNKMSMIREELIELNDKFHNKSLVTESFYKQLVQAGFAYRQCVLISIFPDSANTYCGQIVRQDGCVFEFDVDLDCSEYSDWKDITDNFRKVYEQGNDKKPWSKEVVALQLFSELKAR